MAEISLELIGRRLDAIQTELREFKFAVDVDRRDAASWRTNLIIEVAAKLATFELHIDNRLAQMDEGLAQVDEKVSQGLAQVDQKIGQGLAQVDQKIGQGLAQMDEKIGQGLAQVDERLGRIETLLHQLVSK